MAQNIEATCKATRKALLRWGYDVTEVSSGDGGPDLVVGPPNHPDVVVVLTESEEALVEPETKEQITTLARKGLVIVVTPDLTWKEYTKTESTWAAIWAAPRLLGGAIADTFRFRAPESPYPFRTELLRSLRNTAPGMDLRVLQITTPNALHECGLPKEFSQLIVTFSAMRDMAAADGQPIAS